MENELKLMTNMMLWIRKKNEIFFTQYYAKVSKIHSSFPLLIFMGSCLIILITHIICCNNLKSTYAEKRYCHIENYKLRKREK